MVESWIFYGLFASLFFGVNAIVYKVAAVNGGLNPFYAGVFYGAGIFLTLLIAYFLKFSAPTTNFKWLAIALIAGIIWGVGFLMTALAISQHADVARLAPLYNTNTLVAVVLGIILLKELPSSEAAWRVVLGAVLIVAGSVLVSMK
ncbi:MAG TPA: GRP family sugar transporter [Candidatus Nanoarchaeia archaeon]|nr:GRP family sugar transporter [Candidatus Nanoarchaeia archaeon]